MTSRRRKQSREAMTLIEIMVVCVIMVLVASGTIYGVRMLGRTSLRSGCMRIIAASHFAYARAVTRGATIRVVIDVDQNTVSIEEARGRVELVHAGDATRRAIEDNARRDGDDVQASAVDPWAAAQAAIQRTERPTFGASPFGAIKNADGEPIKRYQPTPIATGVKVLRMYLPHEPEARVHGRGSIYFFPGGRTEHAAIQISDGRTTVYTVEINGLNGHGTLHPEEWRPVSIPDDVPDSDRRRSALEDR